MHNCKKRVVQCLNVSFITVAQSLTELIHVFQLKFGIQNDDSNGTNLKRPEFSSAQSRPEVMVIRGCPEWVPKATTAETPKSICGDSTDYSHG